MGDDREITLGTGRLLGLFFGLVIVCAVFFGLGFSMGKSSEKANNASEPVPVGVAVSGAPKPVAGKPGAPPVDCAATPEGCPPGAADKLTFYKSVEQSTPAELGPPPGSSLPASGAATQRPASEAPPETARPMFNGGYIVQVAAVSKQEDADALVSALRKKQYPVFIAGNPPDGLHHVQLGPFADLKEAEAMRSRLMGDGYNPIVKK